MNKAGFILMTLLAVTIIAGCSKKTHPATAAAPATSETAKPVRKATFNTTLPKLIIVNDKMAKTSINSQNL